MFRSRKSTPASDESSSESENREVLPDYESLVERELRVADGAADAAIMWAPILKTLQALQATMKYIYVGRRRK